MALEARYPVEYEEEVVLRDGRIARLRPVRPDDAARVRALFLRLSPESAYLRFRHALRQLAEEEVQRVVGVDYHTTFALVATVGAPGREEVVAVGQYARAPEQPTAEVSFVVADEYQGLGIGTLLLEHLARIAREHGVTALQAEVLEENRRMMDVFQASGFETSVALEQGVYRVRLPLESWEEAERRAAEREHLARVASIRHLLRPRSVAVVGASRQPDSIGGALFRNLLENGFQGPVYPVNPNAAHVRSVRAYPSVLAVPDDVDLAVVVVPAALVLEVVEECARKGVRGLVVISAGFREAGQEGVEREATLRLRVRGYGMRLVGPNCLGVLNTDPEVRLNATFSPVFPPAGKVAIASQSGALGLAILDYARAMNVGLSSFVSVGNRADVSSNDLLEYWEDDPNTEVILLYLESFGNPARFSRIARRVARSKPILAVKGGRSGAGARAAASHTGALASADVAVDALFRQAGVVRVETIEELFGAAAALADQPAPRGRRLAVLTNAGGPGILAADAAEGHGLEVPRLAEESEAALRGFLPREASVSNPVDMIASATPEQYTRSLRVLLDDPATDAILLIYIPPLVTTPEQVAAAVRQATREYRGEKPVLACFMTSGEVPMALRSDGGRTIPSFPFPEDAVRALARVVAYRQWREAPQGRVPEFPDARREEARALLAEALRGQAGEELWLYPEQALALLGAYGIPVPPMAVAFSAEEAAERARGVGFPVALKVRSPRVLHKTDVGGVVLGLEGEEAVAWAYRAMMERLAGAGVAEASEGVLVQQMAPRGVEVVVGMSTDQSFGPLVMVGLGGVFVELLRDVGFRLHPLTDMDVGDMLRQLRGYPLLTGYRGAPAADVAALEDLVLRFSALIEDVPQVLQVDMNPVLALPRGQGCVVVDARIQVARRPEAEAGLWDRRWRSR